MRITLGLNWGQPDDVYYQLREGITLVARHPKPASHEPYIEAKYPKEFRGEEGEVVGVIAINDQTISREHGLFEFDGNEISYMDNNSKNGTFLQRHGSLERLPALTRYSLQHEDELFFTGLGNNLPYRIAVVDRTVLEATRFEW